MRAVDALRDEAQAVADRLIERSAARGNDVVRAPALEAEDERDPVAEATLHADEAFASLAFVEARQALETALEAADAGHLRSREQLVASLLLSAMVYGAVGDDALADQAARDALGIDPTLTLDPARYPPTLAARVDALRPTLARCAVHVVTDPSDAALRIDGASASAPDALGCGPHWITASRAGYASLTRRVEITPDHAHEDVTLALAIDPAAALASPGGVGDPIPPLMERAAAALGRELVVLALVQDDDGGVRATLGARSVHVPRAHTPDDVASALLAPIERGLDSEVVIGLGVGIGAAVAAAVAIGLAVALAPQSPNGWVGVGEVIRP